MSGGVDAEGHPYFNVADDECNCSSSGDDEDRPEALDEQEKPAEVRSGKPCHGVLPKNARSFIAANGDWLVSLETVTGETGRRTTLVECSVCKQNCGVANGRARGGVCKFADGSGVIYSGKRVLEHHHGKIHAAVLKHLADTVSASASCMRSRITNTNDAFFSHVCHLLMVVYNDAKRGTISEFSFPTRVLAATIGNLFKFDRSLPFEPFEPSVGTCKYVNVTAHRRLLQLIGTAGREALRREFTSGNVIAACAIVDGESDRNAHHSAALAYRLVLHKPMASKYLRSLIDALVVNVFGSIQPLRARGAHGYLEALKRGTAEMLGGDADDNASVCEHWSFIEARWVL